MPRRDCRECAGVIRETGEHASLACLRQWEVLEALNKLDDARERHEINEALAAAVALIGAMNQATADGITSGAEIAELRVLGQQLLREINDLVHYDDHENAQHDAAVEAETSAREHSGAVSHRMDDAIAAIDNRRAGGVGQGHLWAPGQTPALELVGDSA